MAKEEHNGNGSKKEELAGTKADSVGGGLWNRLACRLSSFKTLNCLKC